MKKFVIAAALACFCLTEAAPPADAAVVAVAAGRNAAVVKVQRRGRRNAVKVQVNNGAKVKVNRRGNVIVVP